MNFSEFKRRLGAEPRSREAALLAARRSGPEFEQAAREAEAFEDRLEATLRFPVDSEALLEEWLTVPDRPPGRARIRGYAIAAGILAVAGVAAILRLQGPRHDSLEEYLASHFEHDGRALLAQAGEGAAHEQVEQVLARFGARAAPELVARVRYIKVCPGMDQDGAHMVVATDQGLVTLFYLPGTSVRETLVMSFDGQTARLQKMGSGAAAVIGAERRVAAVPEDWLRRVLRPGAVDT